MRVEGRGLRVGGRGLRVADSGLRVSTIRPAGSAIQPRQIRGGNVIGHTILFYIKINLHRGGVGCLDALLPDVLSDLGNEWREREALLVQVPPGEAFRVKRSGFRIQGLGLRVQGSGFRG